MLELLQSIKGPYFLIGYIIFTTIVAYLTKFIITTYEKKNSKTVNIFNLQPLEVLVARNNGDYNKVLRYYLFRMWVRKSINVEVRDKDMYISSTENYPDSGIECEIFHTIKDGIPYKKLSQSKALKEYIENITNHILRHLEERKIVKTKNHINKEKFICKVMGILLLFPGVIKVIMGLSNGKSSGFLILLLILSQVAFYTINSINFNTETFNDYLKDEKETLSKDNYSNIDTNYIEMLYCVNDESSLIKYPETIVFGTALTVLTSIPNSSSSSGCSSCSSCSSCGGCGA